MPAESSRFRRRLGRRDLGFLGFMAAAAVVGVLAVALLLRGGTASGPLRCVKQTRAGFMGAYTYTYCGKAAVTFCGSHAGTDRTLAAQCARLELAGST